MVLETIDYLYQGLVSIVGVILKRVIWITEVFVLRNR